MVTSCTKFDRFDRCLWFSSTDYFANDSDEYHSNLESNLIYVNIIVLFVQKFESTKHKHQSYSHSRNHVAFEHENMQCHSLALVRNHDRQECNCVIE